MQDQTGFDGFTQANLIRQEHAGMAALTDLICNVELMWNEIDAGAKQPAHRQTRKGLLVPKGFEPQTEPDIAVDLPGKKPLFRLIKVDVVGQLGLRQHDGSAIIALADVGEQSLAVLNPVDGHMPAVLALNAVASIKAHPGERGAAGGVKPRLPARLKADGHPAVLDMLYMAKAKVGLGIANPALADNVIRHKIRS